MWRTRTLAGLASLILVALLCSGGSVSALHSDVPHVGLLASSEVPAQVCAAFRVSFSCPAHVTFIELGLPDGTMWSITINGSTWPTTSEGIMFGLSNGTYPYEVGNVSGYSASPSSGTVIVSGDASVGVTIYFTSTATPAGPTPLVWGLPPAVAFIALGTALGVVAAAQAFFAWRSARLKSKRVPQDGRHLEVK
jgi:hypothetical protein